MSADFCDQRRDGLVCDRKPHAPGTVHQESGVARWRQSDDPIRYADYAQGRYVSETHD